MCSRDTTWLSDNRRDVLTSSQSQAPAVVPSPQTRLVADANHNTDNSPRNKWATSASGTGDIVSTPSPSPAVSELVDKGVLYLRDRIFNRDSGKI